MHRAIRSLVDESETPMGLTMDEGTFHLSNVVVRPDIVNDLFLERCAAQLGFGALSTSALS